MSDLATETGHPFRTGANDCTGDGRGEESARGTPLPLPAAAAACCSTFKASVAFWKPKTETMNVFVCRWGWEVMRVSANAVFGLGGGQQASRMGTFEVKQHKGFSYPSTGSLDSVSSYDQSELCLISHKRI